MKERLLAGGCFDILHDSHREWLKIVASKASHIKFTLATDEAIAYRKGKDRPLFPYEWRREDVENRFAAVPRLNAVATGSSLG